MAKKEYANEYKGKKYIIPRGRLSERPGPHKRSSNRIVSEELISFLPKNLKEKIIKFADKFDEKQFKKADIRKSTVEMKKRAKKLTAYKGYT